MGNKEHMPDLILEAQTDILPLGCLKVEVQILRAIRVRHENSKTFCSLVFRVDKIKIKNFSSKWT